MQAMLADVAKHKINPDGFHKTTPLFPTPFINGCHLLQVFFMRCSFYLTKFKEPSANLPKHL